MNIIYTEKQNCRDCYKCLRRCPLRAVRIHEGHAQVDPDRCVSCGSCINVCPQHAIRIRNSVSQVREMIVRGDMVIASLAPSWDTLLQFGGPSQLADSLKRLGFSAVEEIYPAIQVLGQEYMRLLEGSEEPIIASLCPSIVRLVERYFPDRLSHMVDLVSPPIAHARMLRARLKNTEKKLSIVHITPCVSSKQEIYRPEYEGLIDSVLTVGELNDWLREEGIETIGVLQDDGSLLTDVNLCDSLRDMAEFFSSKRIRTNDMAQSREFLEFFPQNMRNLRVADLRSCSTICPNSLVVGTGSLAVRLRRPMLLYREPSQAQEDTASIYGKTSFELTRLYSPDPISAPVPTESEIREIFARIGIYRKEDEMDCGACGYNTCMEKAIAVFQGMAEIEMCMPYMKRQATHSYSILEHTPNAVVMVNHRGLIQFANPGFYRIFRVQEETVLAKPVKDYIKSDCFERAVGQERAVSEKFNVPELGIFCRAEIFRIEGEDLLGSVIVDITQEEINRKELLHVKEETLNRAKEVITKQMSTAQEIASLLGETTAETKVLLVKLMKLFEHEERT